MISKFRHKYSSLKGYIFDLIQNVETNSTVSEKELGFTHPDLYPYVPVDVTSFKKILKSLPIKSEDVFCDIGCGKGRALILAENFPFKKIIGIDINKDLIEVAKRNIKQNSKFKLICDDATKSPFNDEVTFLFMACPFSGKLFESFMSKLEESLKRAPRDFIFLYQTPVEKKIVENSTFLKKQSIPVSKYQESYQLYYSSF